MSPVRQLSVALRIMAGLDMLAVTAMAAPWSWLSWAAQLNGYEIGETVPLVHYLTRTASGMYVVYGALLWFLSLRPAHHASVIRFLAWTSVVHSAAVLAVDVTVGMPLLWTISEFGGHLAEAVVLLVLLRRASL